MSRLKSSEQYHVASDINQFSTLSPLFTPTNNTISQSYEREIENTIQKAMQNKDLSLINRDLTGEISYFFSDSIQSAYLRGFSPVFETINLTGAKFDIKGFTGLIDILIRCSLVDNHDETIKLKKLSFRQTNLSNNNKEYGTVLAKLIMECNGSIRELDLCDSQLGIGGVHSLVSATFTSTMMENLNVPLIYSIYQLLVLDLSGNNIGDMGVLSICKGMASLVRRHQPINLQILRLNRNNITDHGAQCITQQLMLMISSSVSNATTTVYDHFGLTPSPHQKQYNNTLIELTNSSYISKSLQLGQSPAPSNSYSSLSYMKLQELDLDDNNIGITGIHSLLSILPTYNSLRVLSLARCQPNFTVLEILSSVLSSGTTMIDFIDLKFTERVSLDSIEEVRKMIEQNRNSNLSGKLLDKPWTSMMRRLVDGIQRRSGSSKDEVPCHIRIHLGVLPQVMYDTIRTTLTEEQMNQNQSLMDEKIDMIGALDLMYYANDVFRLPTVIQRWIANNHEIPSSTEILLASITNDEIASWSLANQLDSLSGSKVNESRNPVVLETLPNQQKKESQKTNDDEDFDISSLSSNPTIKSNKSSKPLVVIPPSPKILSNDSPSISPSLGSLPGGVFAGGPPSKARRDTGNDTKKSSSTLSLNGNDSNQLPHQKALKAVAEAAEATMNALKSSGTPMASPIVNRLPLPPEVAKSRLAFNFEDYSLPQLPEEPVLKSSAAMAASLLGSRPSSPIKVSKKGDKSSADQTYESLLNESFPMKIESPMNNPTKPTIDILKKEASYVPSPPATPPRHPLLGILDTGPALGGLDTLLLSPSSRLALNTLNRGIESNLTNRNDESEPVNVTKANALATLQEVNEHIRNNQQKGIDIVSKPSEPSQPHNHPSKQTSFNKDIEEPKEPQSDDRKSSNEPQSSQEIVPLTAVLGPSVLRPSSSKILTINPSGTSEPVTTQLINKQIQELERIRKEKLAAMKQLAEVAEDLVKSSDSLSFLEPSPHSMLSFRSSSNTGVNTALKDILDEKTQTYGSALTLNTNPDHDNQSIQSMNPWPLTSTSNQSIGSLATNLTEDGIARIVKKALTEEIESSLKPLLIDKGLAVKPNETSIAVPPKEPMLAEIKSPASFPIRSPLAMLVHQLDPENKSNRGPKAPWSDENAFVTHPDQSNQPKSNENIVSPTSGKKRIKVSTPKRSIRIDVTLPTSPTGSAVDASNSANGPLSIMSDTSAGPQPFNLSRLPQPSPSPRRKNIGSDSPHDEKPRSLEVSSMSETNNVQESDKRLKDLSNELDYLHSRMSVLERMIQEEQISPRAANDRMNRLTQSPRVTAKSMSIPVETNRLLSMSQERELISNSITQVERELKQLILNQQQKIDEFEQRRQDLKPPPIESTTSKALNAQLNELNEFVSEVSPATASISPLQSSNNVHAMTSPIPSKQSTLKAAIGSPLYDALTSLVNQTSSRSVYGADDTPLSTDPQTNPTRMSMTASTIVPNNSTVMNMSTGMNSLLSKPGVDPTDPIHDLNDRMKNLETALEAEHESTIKVLEILMNQSLKSNKPTLSEQGTKQQQSRSIGQSTVDDLKQQMNDKPNEKHSAILGPRLFIGQGIIQDKRDDIRPSLPRDLNSQFDADSYSNTHSKNENVALAVKQNKSNDTKKRPRQDPHPKQSSPFSDDSYFDDIAQSIHDSIPIHRSKPPSAIEIPLNIQSDHLKPSQSNSNRRRTSNKEMYQDHPDTIRLTTSITRDNASKALKNINHRLNHDQATLSETKSIRSNKSTQSGSKKQTGQKQSGDYLKQLSLPHLLPPPPQVNRR